MQLKPTVSPGRFKEIITVFAKYGFEDVVDYLNLPGRRTTRKLTHVPQGLTPYERIRMAFDELGPTFVKFGQILSLRSDLLPRPLIVELEKLQDKAAPLSYDVIKQVLSQNLPKPPEALFAQMEASPAASASLSQVHRALLKPDLRPVALKVQRPEIRGNIERDLDIFAFIARQLDQHLESLQVYELPELVRLVRKTLRRELNFLTEARNIQIAKELLKSMDGICIPAVYRFLSSERVLVLDFVDGVRPGSAHNGSTAEMASVGLRASVKQILENGFFHADPHPGNLLITGDARLCLLDWGMVGRLTPQDRDRMIDLIGAVIDRDIDDLVDAILTLSGSPTTVDRRALQIDVMELLDLHTVAAVEDIRLGMLLLDISDLIRKHRLRVPPDLYLMFKSLVSAEGTARLIHPQLDVIAELKPHIERLAMARFHPARILHRMRMGLFKLVSSPARFPKRVAEVVEILQRGDLKMRFEHHNLGPLRATLEKTFSRLTLGIISGAMIIGSSLILITELPPMMAGYSLLGLTGYLIAGLVGLWVIFDILRSR